MHLLCFEKLFVSDLLEERDEIGAFLRLLDTRENHLGTRDVLLRVQQVCKEGVLAPHNARVLVRRCVGVPFHGAALTSEDPVQVGALLGDTATVVCNVVRFTHTWQHLQVSFRY